MRALNSLEISDSKLQDASYQELILSFWASYNLSSLRILEPDILKSHWPALHFKDEEAINQKQRILLIKTSMFLNAFFIQQFIPLLPLHHQPRTGNPSQKCLTLDPFVLIFQPNLGIYLIPNPWTCDSHATSMEKLGNLPVLGPGVHTWAPVMDTAVSVTWNGALFPLAALLL